MGDSGVEGENEKESLFEEEPAVVVEFEFPGETKAADGEDDEDKEEIGG